MERYAGRYYRGKDIFIGIDLHLKSWQVTIRTYEEELFCGSIPGDWGSLEKVLGRFEGSGRMAAVYEAGYFGFWLYDQLISYGVDCIVTPPSLIPREYGNRVKTDRRDSRKLAFLLSRGMLKSVWVPSSEQRCQRQVVRTRRQLVRDRVDVQLRIKSLLRSYGLELTMPQGHWSRSFAANLRCLKISDVCLWGSLERLLDQYDFLCLQIGRQEALLRELSRSEAYRKSFELLQSIFGIGLISAMEILLEIGDFTRFGRGGQLTAYVGLTPSQYSSGEKVRMGRITGIGKSSLRGLLIEVAWRVISRDQGLRKKYEDIRSRSGAKRAIVAIARRLLLRIRRMMIDGVSYREVQPA